MPGTEVSLVEAINPRTFPTDTGVAFFAVVSATGPANTYTRLTGLEQYEAIYGGRTGAGIPSYDAVEVFFREGGSILYVSKAASANSAGVGPALDIFTKELGPGQVAAPGVVGVGADLLDHAATNHRIALIDAVNDPDVPDVEAAATALAGADGVRYAGMWGPWLVINGVAPGTTRTVAPSAVVAGIIARSDRGNNPNVAAAGQNGQSRTAIGLAQTYTTAEAETLSDAGINTFRNVAGTIENYGFRSLSPKATDPEWWQLTAGRLYMAIAARSEPVLHRALFAQLDGGRTRLGQLEGELAGVLLDFWREGALYGVDPSQAFRVDATSESVNPDVQLREGIVRAVAEVRISPFGEIVRLELKKTPITEQVS